MKREWATHSQHLLLWLSTPTTFYMLTTKSLEQILLYGNSWNSRSGLDWERHLSVNCDVLLSTEKEKGRHIRWELQSLLHWHAHKLFSNTEIGKLDLEFLKRRSFLLGIWSENQHLAWWDIKGTNWAYVLKSTTWQDNNDKKYWHKGRI
jgi:hypothetical protein